MERHCFKLYRKFNRKRGLPLSSYEKILKDHGFKISLGDLRFSMDRACNLGLAVKKLRRYRMPWKLCDYHIVRTLGVKGLPPAKSADVSRWVCCKNTNTNTKYKTVQWRFPANETWFIINFYYQKVHSVFPFNLHVIAFV